MSPVTRLARLPGRILLFVHMGNFSAVDRDAIKETQPKWWNVSLAVVAVWTLQVLLIKLIRILLKWKYIHLRKKKCHFRWYVARAKLFCLKNSVSFRLQGLECLFRRNFIPVTARSPSHRASDMNTSRFLRMEEWRGEISETEAARRSTKLI